jgi:hypothetical protein
MGKEEAPDLNDQGPDAIGVPSTGLSLGWMLASRASLRFTRHDGNYRNIALEARASKNYRSGRPVKV